LLPPPHPAKQSAAREDQAGNASASDGTGDGGGVIKIMWEGTQFSVPFTVLKQG